MVSYSYGLDADDDWSLADHVCCHNKHYAEPSGFARKVLRQLSLVLRSNLGIHPTNLFTCFLVPMLDPT